MLPFASYPQLVIPIARRKPFRGTARSVCRPGRRARVKCGACHSLGQGSKVGPDLAGVTELRDRRWLLRYIAGPDEMLKAGDPIAKALFAKYKEMRMPNLELTDQQVEEVVVFLASIRPASTQ